MGLTAEQIMQAKDTVVVERYIEEWGGNVFIRNLTADEWEKVQDTVFDKNGSAKGPSFKAVVALHALCNKDGERLFADEQYSILAAKGNKPLAFIANVAQGLTGLTNAELEERKKKSETIPENSSDSV
jgi:hypothetical protein